MILDRDKEKKNHGKTTHTLSYQLPDDICGKLKNLDLRGCEASKISEGKLKVTDNFSKLKDLKKNNFGDEAVNNIGDQFSNIKIVDEYNFPPSKKGESLDKIVLNIVCDNNIQDNKYSRQDNINSDEEQILSHENKTPDTDFVSKKRDFENKSKGKLITVDEATELVCNVSNGSKKTEENIGGFCSRGPISQKICQQTFEPYNKWTCSRSHHSGGKVCIQEPVGLPSQPAMNGYQQWTDIPDLNIISNGQEQSVPPEQKSYLPVTERHTNINITSENAAQGFSLSPEDACIVQTLLDNPLFIECFDMVNGCSTPHNMGAMTGGDSNRNKLVELLPSSPEDSATSSLGSPIGSDNQQPSGCDSDSGVGSPTDHLPTLYEDPTDNCYLFSEITDSQERQISQERPQIRQTIQERPFLQGRHMVQEAPVPQGRHMVQEAPVPQGRHLVQEAPVPQGRHMVPKAPVPQGRHMLHEAPVPHMVQEAPVPQVRHMVQEARVPQGRHMIHEVPVPQGRQMVQEAPVPQGRQMVLEAPVPQGRKMVQEAPVPQGRQMVQEAPVPQGRQMVQEAPVPQGRQMVQEAPVPQGRQIVCDGPATKERQTSPGKSKVEVIRYRPILPKPERKAKARFQQILDKDRRLLAWLKVFNELKENENKLETQDAEGDTDLMIVCSNKFESQLEIIYAMVERMRHVPNSLTITNKQGHSALYLACKVLFDVPEVAAYIAEALLEQKVDIANMTFDGGLTLIQILEKEGDSHKKVLEELLTLTDSSGKNVFQPSGNDLNANNFKDFNEEILLL